MRTQLTLAVALLMVAGCSPKASSPQGEQSAIGQPPPLQCATDTVCKGDRICVDGMCQEPTNTTPKPAISAKSSTRQSNYSGKPSQDDRFASFIESNIGKIVTIDVVTTEEESMPEGYRGGDPSFLSKAVNGLNRQFVIDCRGYEDFPSVALCGKNVKWDDALRRMRGTFRVFGVEKYPQVWVYTLRPEAP